MAHKNSLNLECPHCKNKCQFMAMESEISLILTKNLDSPIVNISTRNSVLQAFEKIFSSHQYLSQSDDEYIHEAFRCTNCKGLILVKWLPDYSHYLYFPQMGDFKPKVDLNCIEKEEVRDDFKEAINCYNNRHWNASMIMSRRTLQQEVLVGEDKSQNGNLMNQIESMEISKNHKEMFHRVRIFGNSGAHPDFCLYDESGDLINKEDKKEIAKTALHFLDHYFVDKYEIPKNIGKCPKGKKNN